MLDPLHPSGSSKSEDRWWEHLIRSTIHSPLSQDRSSNRNPAWSLTWMCTVPFHMKKLIIHSFTWSNRDIKELRSQGLQNKSTGSRAPYPSLPGTTACPRQFFLPPFLKKGNVGWPCNENHIVTHSIVCACLFFYTIWNFSTKLNHFYRNYLFSLQHILSTSW